MASFKLKQFAQIQHLNIRKEGPDDAKEVAIDIKFYVEKCPIEHVMCTLGAENLADVRHLWIDDEAACVRLMGISTIDSNAQYRNGYQIELLRNVSYITKISKFKLHLQDGLKTDLTFSVSIHAPTNALTLALSDNVMDTVLIEIIPPTEFDFSPEENKNDQ